MGRVLAIILMLFPAAAHAGDSLEVSVRQLIRLLSDSTTSEVGKARHIVRSNDSRHLAAVFFSLEGFNGGNNHTEYLALFEPDWGGGEEMTESERIDQNVKKFRLVGYVPIGGSGWRMSVPESCRIERDRIQLNTLEQGANDSVNAPTKPGKTIVLIRPRQLIEIPDRTY